MIKTVLVRLGWLFIFVSGFILPTSHAYVLGLQPDQMTPNPAYVQIQTSADRGNARIVDVELYGGDTFAAYGGLCDPYDTSCIRITVRRGKTVDTYYKSVPKCIPSRGTGSLAAATTAFVKKNFSGSIPKVENWWGDDVRSETFIAFKMCDNPSFHIQYSSEGSPTTPLVCSLQAPGLVDLGVVQEQVIRNIETTLKCSGDGAGTVRINVSGPSQIEPSPGVNLWTSVPEENMTVSGDGIPYIVNIKVGATNSGGIPGKYEGEFIYVIEYI